ncbi:MAG TPA: trypsin-like peptidase domain-containing protein [Planctomycetota bacterium]|nr:trypsin-like peptidase domain-containing protein [Planctomycetota bacterium]
MKYLVYLIILLAVLTVSDVSIILNSASGETSPSSGPSDVQEPAPTDPPTGIGAHSEQAVTPTDLAPTEHGNQEGQPGDTGAKPGELDEAGSSLLKKIDPSVVMIQHELGLGSGYIVTADGYILTNGHVISTMDRNGEDPMEIAKFITVVMSDEKSYKGKVIGHCLDPDVALVKIEPENPLTPIELGDSDSVKAGQRVYAYGSPGGLKRTLTAGILSNIERTDIGTFTRVFQTDAPINPGNSGGPLLNEKGEVIGMNTYGGGQEGIGFAIPINVVKVLRGHFLKYGRFKRADIPFFFTNHLDDNLAQVLGVAKGLLVSFLEDNSYIYQAGLRTGDIIVAIDDKEISARTPAEANDINWAIVCREIGSVIKLKVVRSDTHDEYIIEAKMVEDEPAVEYAYQLGEIKELRYDDLGLGVKMITTLTQYIYELPHRKGVRVTMLQPNSSAAKADIQMRDMITRINDVAINAIDDFQKELEKSLTERKKFISLVIQRGNTVVRTALKPFYDLAPSGKARKKVLIWSPVKDAMYLDIVTRLLMTNGAEFEILFSDKMNDKTNFAGFDGIILMTGDNIKNYWNDKNIISGIKYCLDNKKALGAIGGASVILVNADEKFISKKITTAEEYSSVMMDKKANYTGGEVQSDGLVITTTGFDDKIVKAFLNVYKGVLRNIAPASK